MGEMQMTGEWTDEGSEPATSAETKADAEYQASILAEREKLGLTGSDRDALHPAERVRRPLEPKLAHMTGMGSPLVDDSTNARNAEAEEDRLVAEHKRAELDKLAAKAGVDEPEKLSTKADVADAIHAAETPKPADEVDLPETKGLSRKELDKLARSYDLDPADYKNRDEEAAAIRKAAFEA